MSRAGNFFSNKIGLNNFWLIKLNINYSKILSFFFTYLLFLDNFLKLKKIYIINFCFKIFRGDIFYLYINIYINFFNFKIKKINFFNKKKLIIFFNKFFFFNNIFYFNFNNLFSFKFLVLKLFYINYFLNNLFFFKKININLKNNRLNLIIFNKIKINLIINYINFLFQYKNKFFFKLKFRSLNSKFLKFFKFNKNFGKKYNYLYNSKKLISLIYYSFLFKNNSLISNFILYLFSSWKKNHFIVFRTITEILDIFFNSNILNLKGFYLQVKGKINGQKRKIKLTHSLGKLNFSKFKSKMSYNFFSKLTIFGSIGIKVWFIYDG